MRRILREPLLHFFVLGALLFGLYSWLHGGADRPTNEIVVSRGQIESLEAQFERVWQRRASSDELNGLIDTWVRDEIFYREGIAMGLDRDDPIVRRRVAQKLEFIVDGALPSQPTVQDLQTWLDTHASRYAVQSRYSLQQIYFDPSRHGERLESALAAARRDLALGKPVTGDTTLLLPVLEAAEPAEITRAFGNEFTQAVQALPVGSWHGPIRSGFGLHLVQVTAREEGRPASLEEVRAAVERDWLQARARQANDALYERLRSNYEVRIEGRDAAFPAPVG